MVNIRQTQRTINFSATLFKKKAEFILEELGYKNFELGIWLTTNKAIQKYNHLYRNKNQATDILSFPYHTELIAGEKIKIKDEEDKNLGDLIISMAYVFNNKKELPGDFIARMDRLLVHGICHLLGYDHIKDKDYKKMLALENKLLKNLNNYFKKS
ncbi:rRNA maturation RNase YbeY [Candidatus Dependentiae bacterium]|nr:rRNA maturation RNase YbeY [Candidatus Dependentiae bacterium]